MVFNVSLSTASIEFSMKVYFAERVTTTGVDRRVFRITRMALKGDHDEQETQDNN